MVITNVSNITIRLLAFRTNLKILVILNALRKVVAAPTLALVLTVIIVEIIVKTTMVKSNLFQCREK